MELREPLLRLKPIADPLAGIIDQMIYILKAPMLGWRESARGLSLARHVTLVESGGVPRGGEILSVAKSMEGGASPDAFFQSLRERVFANLARSVSMYNEIAGALAMSAIIMAVFSSIPLFALGSSSLLTLLMLGIVILLMRPGDHYYTITLLDIIGLIAGLVIGFFNTAGGFLAYGLATLPLLIQDWRLASGLRDRVTISFGELLTRPRPKPVVDITPVEGGLRRMWLEARASGAQSFIGWANQLIIRYLEGLNEVRISYMIYGIIVLSFVGGLSLWIPLLLGGLLTQASASQSLIAGYLNLSALRSGEFYNVIGIGWLSGCMFFDYRLAGLLAGIMGLVAWFII